MQLQAVGAGRISTPDSAAALAAAASAPATPGDAAAPGASSREREARLRRIVDGHIDFVARILRNAGSPAAEIDDDVQRTFIIAARKLDEVRPGAEKSFILRVALNVAAHARRTIARRREVHDAATLRAGRHQRIARAAGAPQAGAAVAGPRSSIGLHVDLRTVFVLFEIEEMSMIEIAGALGIPQGTVASRLRRARAEFRAASKTLRAVSESGGEV